MKKATERVSPLIEVPSKREAHSAWWEEWVAFVRNSPRIASKVEGKFEDIHYYGEHLFIGCETHKILYRGSRAVGVSAGGFSDGLEYQDIRDVRAWAQTKPNTLLLHEEILGEHCYIVGPSGAGKTSLGIMPILMQIIRGAQTATEDRPEPFPLVILDLKGDSALFNTVKQEAANRKQPFKFFSTERDAPTFRFNPFRGFNRESRSIAQLCQLILDSLSLNHGKGYGRSYYTERSRNILAQTLRDYPHIYSFKDLHASVGAVIRSTPDPRARNDAFELLSVIEMLTEYKQLVTGPDENLSTTEDVIFMPNVLKNREVAYFWLPAALESISVGEIAKLVLFNLRTAAQDWKQQNPVDQRKTVLVIDELQRVAGENLQGILQDARSFGIRAILANQSLEDLQSATGFDLAPTIMTNTRVKFFFTSPSEQECYVYVERAKGFTDACPFPQMGNPWLADLGKEEFGYHVHLAWPLPFDEYKKRDVAGLPDWSTIPGNGAWLKEAKQLEAQTKTGFVAAPAYRESTARVDIFEFKRDEIWKNQVHAIRSLFPDDGTAIEELVDDDGSFSFPE